MKSSQAAWIVRIDRKEILVSQTEYEGIKQASIHGKAQVWLDDVMISIPHISYMEKIKNKAMPDRPQLNEPLAKDMSGKIKELKAQLLRR